MTITASTVLGSGLNEIVGCGETIYVAQIDESKHTSNLTTVPSDATITTPTVFGSDLTGGTFLTLPSKYSSRASSNAPTTFRLGKKLDGTLVLQGGFEWKEMDENGRYTKGGLTWEDLPTVDLED